MNIQKVKTGVKTLFSFQKNNQPEDFMYQPIKTKGGHLQTLNPKKGEEFFS